MLNTNLQIPEVEGGISRLLREAFEPQRRQLAAIATEARGCPTFARLYDIVLDSSGAATEESQHFARCERCRARIEAFEEELDNTPVRVYESEIADLTRETAPVYDQLNAAQKYALARLQTYPRAILLHLTGSTRDAEAAALRAWNGSHVIGEALRVARELKAPPWQKHFVLDACGAAVSAAVSTCLSNAARGHDLAMPVFAMLEEAAIEVSLSEPALRPTYARMYARVVRRSPLCLKTLLVYGINDVATLANETVELAALIAREIVHADETIATRAILSVLFHSDPRLAQALEPAVTAQICDASLHVFEHITRQMHQQTTAVAAMAAATPVKPAAIIAVRQWVADYIDRVCETTDPVQRTLGVLAARYLLGRTFHATAQASPKARATIVQALGQALFDRSAEPRDDTAFFLFTSFEVVHDVNPEVAAELFIHLASRADGGVAFWFGLIRAAVRRYELSFKNRRQEALPRYRSPQGVYAFEGGATEHPLDAFGRCIALAANTRPEIRPALDWAGRRIERWAAIAMG